jgi:hypothetical protein
MPTRMLAECVAHTIQATEAADRDSPHGRSLSRSTCLKGLVGALGLACMLFGGCRRTQPPAPPSIEFTRLPPAGEGSAEILNLIEGRVKGARPGQRIVLFARSGVWWVQPFGDSPFTALQSNFTWKASTHPGLSYAALLVDPEYRPPSTLNALPSVNGPVRAIRVADGPMLEQQARKTLHFSGYEWDVRQDQATVAGARNYFSQANAWVDGRGFLHLRIFKKKEQWTSAGVDLPRSLGYGSYRFVVSDVSQLEPAAVLNISAADSSGPNREMDIEISRWGELAGKNGQYVIQPYYIPANVVRFLAPSGATSYSFDWEPGRVSFRTVRGPATGGSADVVATHIFTSGVPSAGSEALHLSLYVFDSKRNPLQNEVEVIIEKFEYLP